MTILYFVYLPSKTLQQSLKSSNILINVSPFNDQQPAINSFKTFQRRNCANQNHGPKSYKPYPTRRVKYGTDTSPDEFAVGPLEDLFSHVIDLTYFGI